jgi:LPXTG-site transpeptidase (sortase) family protein
MDREFFYFSGATMKFRTILLNLFMVLSLLVTTACQAPADTTEGTTPPPTLALSEATATTESAPEVVATEAATATAEPEVEPTATEVAAPTEVVATEAAVVATSTPVTLETAAGVEGQPDVPVQLTIPKINVSASIESVGNDEQGRMDVPKGVQNAAWWNLGALPGAGGNAVISGHLDNYLQEPAVFWRLRELAEGDTITIRDARGVDYTYEVVNAATYAHDEVPLDIIFGDAVKVRPNLILITCEGTWDETDRNYDQRYVVYARAVES